MHPALNENSIDHSAFCLPPPAFRFLLSAFCFLLSAFRLLPPAFCFLPSAFCLLLSAFCLLPSAFCLLPSAFCFLPSAFLLSDLGIASPLIHHQLSDYLPAPGCKLLPIRRAIRCILVNVYKQGKISMSPKCASAAIFWAGVRKFVSGISIGTTFAIYKGSERRTV
jgi:hypothetical protein